MPLKKHLSGSEKRKKRQRIQQLIQSQTGNIDMYFASNTQAESSQVNDNVNLEVDNENEADAIRSDQNVEDENATSTVEIERDTSNTSNVEIEDDNGNAIFGPLNIYDPSNWDIIDHKLRELLVAKGPLINNDVTLTFPSDASGRHFSINHYIRHLSNGEKHVRRWLIYSSVDKNEISLLAYKYSGPALPSLSIFQTQLKLHSYFSSTVSNKNNNGDRTESTDPIHQQRPPPPIRVSLTESAGRGVFATRRIGVGDLIHTAKPILTHPSLSEDTTGDSGCCYLCLKKIGGCTDFVQVKDVVFCSEECRDQAKEWYEVEVKGDWSDYSTYCRSQGLKYPLMVKRLACMVISGVASAGSLDILQPARLSPQMITKMEEEFSMLKSILTRADIQDDLMAFLTKEWYTSVLARIRINAFRIELAGGSYEDLLKLASASVDAEVAVGNALYMLPSFYNHDCDPNTHIVWIDNSDARMKALRDIEPDEELRICYIDASLDHSARQTLLSEGFGFQCCCLRCSSGD